MVAFSDRRAARRSDLGDIALLMEELVPPDADERFQEDVVAAGVEYESVSAWRLGRRIAMLAGDEASAVAARFAARIRADDVAQAWMLAEAPSHWRDRPETLETRLSAFEAGLGGR